MQILVLLFSYRTRGSAGAQQADPSLDIVAPEHAFLKVRHPSPHARTQTYKSWLCVSCVCVCVCVSLSLICFCVWRGTKREHTKLTHKKNALTHNHTPNRTRDCAHTHQSTTPTSPPPPSLPPPRTNQQPEELRQEGRMLFSTLVATLLTTPRISSVLASSLCSNLTTVSERRPVFMGPALAALVRILENPPTSFSTSAVHSLRRTLRAQLLILFAHEASAEFHDEVCSGKQPSADG